MIIPYYSFAIYFFSKNLIFKNIRNIYKLLIFKHFMDLIGILLILIIIFILITVYSYKIKNKIKTDFRNLFNVGLIWVVIGVIIKNYILGILGVLFLIVAILNHKKWNENKRNLKELFNSEKRLQFSLVAIGLAFLITGIFIYFLSKYY